MTDVHARREPTQIPAASTFLTLQEAERVVGAALRSNRTAIKAWAAVANPGQTKAFTYASASVVGRGVVRSTWKLVDMTNFVLTAYPNP